MRPSTTRAVMFTLTGIIWPALLVAVTLIWPGPGQPADFTPPGGLPVGPSSLPPVDRSGSLMHLVIKYDPGSGSTEVYVDGEEQVPVSRIFWELPQSANEAAEPDADVGNDAAGAES